MADCQRSDAGIGVGGAATGQAAAGPVCPEAKEVKTEPVAHTALQSPSSRSLFWSSRRPSSPNRPTTQRLPPQPMSLEYTIVDTFLPSPGTAFAGNPTAVVRIVSSAVFPPDSVLQAIAIEFNTAATTFVMEHPDSTTGLPVYSIRWFTPQYEIIRFCGHGTMAASHCVFSQTAIGDDVDRIQFVAGNQERYFTHRRGRQFEFEFPAYVVEELSPDETQTLRSVVLRSCPALSAADLLHISVSNGRRDILVEIANDVDLGGLHVNCSVLESVEQTRMTLTNTWKNGSVPEADICSRVFYKTGENPVCGVAHSSLAVYWSPRLGKTSLVAFSASARRGRLEVSLDTARHMVALRGLAGSVMTGTILLNWTCTDQYARSQHKVVLEK
ncbi:uncharacterized protein BJ171DRAFT_496331 [Polychytrium aggregatum]|uniref:uncharacterized protein n=1 Tax=Polychytrium aggregatum TaxID=110093 RepID=UPI0022FE6EDB|nr:uncharacterized protein BJ171DRAFT_496331 [Polychytrium aggregatum]KAI9206612.1 hypothetical protein BJ171DRAFT_496331 [Polychytrium aggregatum]